MTLKLRNLRGFKGLSNHDTSFGIEEITGQN
jgi:hypothetical protein